MVVGRGMRFGRFRGGERWGAIGFSGAVGGGRTKTDSHAWLVNGYKACGGGNGLSGEREVVTGGGGTGEKGRGGRGKREVFLGVFVGDVFVSGILPARWG